MSYFNQDISPREFQVLESISFGLTINEIAKKLYLSPHTIISHRRNLLRKMNAKNGAGLVRKAFEEGLIRVH